MSYFEKSKLRCSYVPDFKWNVLSLSLKYIQVRTLLHEAFELSQAMTSK
jgi:hypothetical protein